jgi:hypothetical protein
VDEQVFGAKRVQVTVSGDQGFSGLEDIGRPVVLEFG